MMNQHSGQGLPDYGEGGSPRPCGLSEVTFYCQAGFRHLLMAGVTRSSQAEVHPDRSGCDWVPPMLKQLDRAYYGRQRGDRAR